MFVADQVPAAGAVGTLGFEGGQQCSPTRVVLSPQHGIEQRFLSSSEACAQGGHPPIPLVLRFRWGLPRCHCYPSRAVRGGCQGIPAGRSYSSFPTFPAFQGMLSCPGTCAQRACLEWDQPELKETLLRLSAPFLVVPVLGAASIPPLCQCLSARSALSPLK